MKIGLLWFEKLYPYLHGVIYAALWASLPLEFPDNDALSASMLSVSGIFVGFLATSKAILISTSSEVIIDLKKSGYIDEVVSYIGQAIWINLAFCLINVVGFFIDRTDLIYSTVWILFGVMSLSAFIRVTDVMLKIFRYS